MPNFPELHNTYVQNMGYVPALYTELAEQLGVSAESLKAIEVGLCPLDEFGCWSWVFPERNAKRTVIGLSKRYTNGKKIMVSGSKRGLVYAAANEPSNQYKNTSWIRVSKECPCQICNKSDGCMYPNGEYESPNAVVCVHVSEGSARPLSDDAPGYLHILDPNRKPGFRSLLQPSEHPVLVVEGASDVCAAFDLGFVGVGKPSAQGGGSFLPELLAGRRCVILGENDAGAGKTGMESTFNMLRKKCSDCVKIMPPEGVKDLRQWKNAGLIQVELLEYIDKHSDKISDVNVFNSDVAYGITERWIMAENTIDGKTILRSFRDEFVKFNGHCYEKIEDNLINQQLYNYLADKVFVDGKGLLKPYKPTRAKIGDIIHACDAFCPIATPCPSWINNVVGPDPKRLIVFQNGVLDVDEYIKGNIVLYDSTPDLFTFIVLPYNFDESLESQIWEDFLNDIFNEDQDKISLLAQWFGYNTVPDMSYEKLTLFTGRPRSGKSTVLETLQAMLGDGNCCETSFQSLAGAFGYQSLVGKLSAIIGDAKSPKSGESNAILEKILHITGGDAVSVNVKNKPILPLIRLFCRFTIAMNDLPAFTDHSRAFEYRTNILTFNNSYVGREDRTLKARLREEANEGKLINFALRGLTDLFKGADFIVPNESAMTMRTFRELVSPIVQFCDVCLVANKSSEGVTADYLYDLWKWWVAREGRNPGLKSTFIRNLLSCLPEAMQIRENEVGIHDRILMGVSVTEWCNKEFERGV